MMNSEVPEKDGYYWVLMGAHTMTRVYLDKDKYTIVKIYSDDTTIKKTRKIGLLESRYGSKSFTLKYFKERATFGAFIEIPNPNELY